MLIIIFKYDVGILNYNCKYICFRTQGKRFTGADKDYGDLDELGCVALETSQEDLEAKKNYILTNLKCSPQEIHELERNTIDQVN